jgi:hypothetical protein
MPLATSLKIGMLASESGGITITCQGLGFRVEHASQTPHQCLPWQAGSGTQARDGERDAGRRRLYADESLLCMPLLLSLLLLLQTFPY